LLIKELSGKNASFVAPEYSPFQCFESGDLVSPPEKEEENELGTWHLALGTWHLALGPPW
jgi:hypothetical protein